MNEATMSYERAGGDTGVRVEVQGVKVEVLRG